MGNLGWDTEEVELIARAKAALAQANVEATSYSALAAACRRGGSGSACTLLFKSPDDLEEARAKFRAADISVTEGKIVWLDVRKSWEELRPSRRLRTLLELVDSTLKSLPGDQRSCSLDQRTRSVSANGIKFAHLDRQCEVVWAGPAEAVLDVPSRKYIEDLVSSCS